MKFLQNDKLLIIWNSMFYMCTVYVQLMLKNQSASAVVIVNTTERSTFVFSHLADTLIQSDLQ